MASLVKELALRFPCFIHQTTIVNTPIFFQNFFNSEVKPLLSESAIASIYITGEGCPKELTE
jgi:hypothetical protein